MGKKSLTLVIFAMAIVIAVLITYIVVNENNNEAMRLYSKLGFKEISLRERYYGEDTAIIMEKVK